MEPDEVKAHFRESAMVDHYAGEAIDIGLWRSEEAVLRTVFPPEGSLLELGCGAGRITFGLWELGYRKILGTDFSREMIAAARGLARRLEYEIPFRVADATALPFEDDLFDGALFGFNGLMQIPGRERRRKALAEIQRVVRSGTKFVFTTHDRSSGGDPGFWKDESERWAAGQQDARLGEFGDRLVATDHGEIFIHIPTRDEVMQDLVATGWQLERDALRSAIATEDATVEAFSVDCRFWVVRKL